MKQRAFERTLMVLMACAVCVGVTSCGDDSPEPPVPAPRPAAAPKPKSPTPSPAAKPAAVKPAVAAPADDSSELERLDQVARQLNADYLTPARAWAGDNFKRKLWVCAIAQRTGRAADLAALARDARAACTGADATFGHFCRVARHFEACASFDEAREALSQAIPLANTPERKTYVATLWRGLPPAK